MASFLDKMAQTCLFLSLPTKHNDNINAGNNIKDNKGRILTGGKKGILVWSFKTRGTGVLAKMEAQVEALHFLARAKGG